MAAGTTLFGSVLVILLAINSHLISFNNAIAAPYSRTARLMDGAQLIPIADQNTHIHMEEANNKEEILEEEHMQRMAVELHDYPGSGANNRHTPRPQFGRCVDC